MRFLAKLAFTGLALLPVACGGTPPPPVATPSAPIASAPPVIATSPLPDLGPAAEPEGTFAIVRWRAPGETFSAVRDLFGVPVPVDEVVDEVLRARAATPSIALDAPVDAVFALDPKAPDSNPKPLMAFSIGLRSLEDARAALDKGRAGAELTPGVFRVDAGRRQGLVCVIGAAAGPAPARLVCAEREKEVLALQPYLSRGMPLVATPDKDVYAELRFAPVQKKFGAQLPGYLTWAANFASYQIGTGDRKLDGAIKDAMTGIAGETVALANDLDKLTIALDLNGGAHAAEAEINLKLKSHDSWISQRMLEKAGEAGPAPAIFWRAPIDSDQAVFGRGGDPRAWAGVKRSSGELMEGLLSQVDFPAAERKTARDLVERLFGSAPVNVSASGSLDTPAPAAGARPGPAEVRNAVVASLGWQLVGIEEPAKRYQDLLNDLANLYNKPAVKNWIVKTGHVDKKLLPTAKVAPFGTGLDKGTRALELTFAIPSPKGAKAAAPVPLYVVVMPDGSRTWLAFGADKAALEKHLAMVKTGAPDSQTIAARPGLESFKSSRVVSGGFVTVAGIAHSANSGLSELLGNSRHNPLQALPPLPNKGQTPILIESTAQGGSPSEVVIKLRSSKGTFDDLRALLGSMGISGRP